MPRQPKRLFSLRIRLRLASLLATLLFFWVSSALALRVVVVRPEAKDPALFEAFGRLRAELALQGFEVVVLQDSGDPIDTSSLELEAQSRDALAAIAFQREEDSTTAEVHIVDRVTGKTVTRKLRISSAKDGPLLLAIRAAELLRTSLLELEPGKPPPPDIVGTRREPPPRDVVRFTRKDPVYQINAGPLVAFHPSLGASFGGALGASFRPIPRLSLGIEICGPLFGGRYATDRGSAIVRQEYGLVQGTFNLGSREPGRRLEWGPLFAAGAAHIEARGNVSSPLVPKSTEVWTFALLGGAKVEGFFNERLSLSAHLAALALLPQPVIAILEEESSPLAVQGLGSMRLGVSF